MLPPSETENVAPAVKSDRLYLNIDGQTWEVERRHEMTQIMRRGRERERVLYLFFYGPGGEVRRNQISEEFPVDPPAALLQPVWRYAEVLHPPSIGEMQSHSSLAIPSLGNVFKLMWRAILLRCPNCGGKHVLKSWFSLRTHCPTCHLRFERGESEDYYLGGMMFNIILAEGLFAVAFAASLIIMWPNVPWEKLEYILAGAAVVAPIALYPVSKIVWLAFDLLFRPVTPEEMEWHANSRTDSSSSK